MNILDYMEELGPAPELSLSSLAELVNRRRDTFMGFMEREHDKGISFVPFDLRTTKGQDVARLMYWRCLEEYAEAVSAKTQEHRLEEIIDSVNYAMGIWACHDFPTARYLGDLHNSLTSVYKNQRVRCIPTRHRLGELVYVFANVTEVFRNRSWMENAQDSYFVGHSQYIRSLEQAISNMAEYFLDWDEFWKYFMAKDMVLQFRLRSNY